MTHTFSLLEGDERDRELLANTHPPAYRNPEPGGRYDLVVVGAGPAGLVSTAVAAGLGARVALVERERLGGECLNAGCVPSKALMACSRRVAEVLGAGEFGVRTGEVVVDFPAIMQRMRRLRAKLSATDSVERFTRAGASVFLGAARFTAPDELEVDGTRLKFHRAIVATGSRPVVPDVPGLADGPYLTNESVFALERLPARLAVIGGGPEGCELGQAFARFGSRVTLIEKGPRLLSKDCEEASHVIRRVLERDGASVLTGATVRRVDRGAALALELEVSGAPVRLEVDAILVAAGRAPNVGVLALEAAGVEFDPRTGIRVDDRLRTTNPRIYAAGDVCSALRFTHLADAHARIAVRNALFFPWASAAELVVPWCTYTDPEVAHVGLTPGQARERGVKIETIRQELRDADRAVLEGEEDGFLEVHLEAGTDRVLGATLVSRHAGETIGELALLITSKAGFKALGRTIHPYPTRAELLRKAADQRERARLTPLVRRLMAWWFS